MKRIIALLLCLVMCLPLFVACGGDDEPKDTTKPAPETNNGAVTTTPTDNDDDWIGVSRDPNAIGKVAVNDWDGYTFKIYYNTQDNAQTDFICDAPNGDTLNDQVYARNSKVEEMLNINLHIDPDTDTTYATLLQNQHDAGWTEGDYNMVTGGGRSAITLSNKGILADLGTYDEINIYSPHWDQGYIDALMIEDSIYSLSGAYSVKSNLFVSSLCFNKNLFAQNGLEEPYNLVKTYEWTVDELLEYMDGFAQDYDNDGYDWSKDRFTISGWATESAYGLFYGSGFSYCVNDGETIEIEYDRDQLDDIIDSVIDVWCKNGAFFSEHFSGIEHNMPFDIFKSGRALFCDIVLQKIGTFFTNMDDDYGILPQPMFSAEQGQYYSYAGYSIPLLVIPDTDPNVERTGNIVEALCAASNDIVIPKMFEIVTKLQNSRDEESADMIDLIISTKFFDSAHWLALTGYEALVRYIIRGKTNTTASYIKIYHDQAVRKLEGYVDAYGK